MTNFDFIRKGIRHWVFKKDENYWQTRSDSYSKHILEEMNSFKKDAWIALIDYLLKNDVSSL
ncbi:hypothetical protein [Desulfoscipio gibsoniae]|uniref:hypothetical protein n=1 Tax=Desulfoscipio gibsoniae TaxID=102134 RepID=UPI0003170525|nr:hypothetical protein [Desulfoscipio gibsoniae]